MDSSTTTNFGSAVLPRPDSNISEQEHNAREINIESKGKTIYVDDQFIWITNDGLLRDEGILFGLAGVSMTEKIEAINSYYSQLKANHEASKMQLSQKILDSKDLLSETRQQILRVESKINKPVQSVVIMQSGNFSRYVLGVILMVIAAYGSYSILAFYVNPVFGRLASIGIFFFSLFAQMTPISTWIHKEEGSGKVRNATEYFLELGPPLSSTLLTAYLIYSYSGDIVMCLVLSLFLFVLLFFCGKLILGMSQRIAEDIKKINASAREKRNTRLEKKRIEEELQLLLGKEESFTKESELLKVRMQMEISRIEELTQESIHKTNLFMSEYQLAAHFSQLQNGTSNG